MHTEIRRQMEIARRSGHGMSLHVLCWALLAKRHGEKADLVIWIVGGDVILMVRWNGAGCDQTVGAEEAVFQNFAGSGNHSLFRAPVVVLPASSYSVQAWP